MTLIPTQPPIEALQENASALFERIYSAFPNDMKCREGCSACCAVDLSVSRSEAERIFRWYESISDAERARIRNFWEAPSRPILDLSGQKKSACVFLSSGSCTIYEARPIICRTQGAPLYFEREKKNQVEGKIDHCPLNFREGAPSEAQHWVHLDRLNALISVANRSEEKTESLRSAELDSLEDKNQRVPLGVLRSHFLKDKL